MFVDGLATGLLLLLGLATLGCALLLGIGLTLILRSIDISERWARGVGFGLPLVLVGGLFMVAFVLPFIGASDADDGSNAKTVQLPSLEG